MQFSDVIGQQPVKDHLREMVDHNRLSHAMMFIGKEGVGALPLALAFSQYIICEKVNGRPSDSALTSLFGESPGVTPEHLTDSCGQCASCRKVQQLIHPDIHYSYPVIPKKPGDKPISTDFAAAWREFIQQYPYGNVFDWLQFIGAENKQGNITSQECLDIVKKMNLKTFESEYRILILWMAEFLGNEGNKLLKLIEEPPPNTVFILIAENESQVLQTISSRTQLISVPPIDTDALEQALIDRAKLPPGQARQLASISDGNFRESLQLMQHAGEDWQSLIREWLNTIVRKSHSGQVRWIEEISRQGREKQKQLLRYFNHLLDQAIRLQVAGDKIQMAESERDFAVRLNKLAGLEQQQAMVEELDKAAYYVERNANAKMLFHALTIKLYHIISDKSLILMT